MRTAKTLTAAIALSLCLYSCNQADHSATSSAYDSTSVTSPSSTPDAASAKRTSPVSATATTPPYENADRKVIRTADFRCRVKDVFAATTHIENTVKAAGGAIADSKIDAEPGDTRTLPYSNDSLRQLQTYTSTAHLTLRIPVQSLDTVLSDIAAQSAFVNSRHLQLSDVTLKYLGNELRNRAAQSAPAGKHGNASGVNLAATIVDRNLENLDLMDNVRYATLTIALYQPERIDAMMIANTNIMMQPAIGQRLRTALNGGWMLVQNFALLLIYIWPLLLAGLAVLIYIRRRKLRRLTPVPAK